MNKGKGNGILLMILTAMVIISLSGVLKRYTTELFTILGLREGYTVDELKSDLNELNKTLQDTTEGTEFNDSSKETIKNAKNLIFRTKKFQVNQEKLERAFLHKIYKNIGIVVLLFIILYLIVKNKSYIGDMFKNIIRLVKRFTNIQERIQKLQNQVKDARDVLGYYK